MSGICGFTEAHESERDRATLRAMCDVMAHRGPDGEGHYVDAGIALGHRRLALVDPEGGGQPMVRATSDFDSVVFSPATTAVAGTATGATIADTAGTPAAAGASAAGTPAAVSSAATGEWAIVFNGEVYNYRELRAELEDLGYLFKTNSDTEVLLVGYIAWSEAVLQRIRGMFAFAIWQRSTGELFCARDPFGIKPFYYTVANVPGVAPEQPRGTRLARRQFIFASEIKSILEHPAYKRELNEAALAQYLCFQFSALPETFFKGVFKLPHSHCLRVSADGKVEVGRYWYPLYEFDRDRGIEETAAEIDAAMRESVRFHGAADAEVGSLLSSGIDSSYLAACLARENPDAKTFSVGFAEYEGDSDEISWAGELAGRLGVENDAEPIAEDEFWDVLPAVQWHMDEPLGDPSAVALYFVDRIAARSVKAVLSGEGADELFGGYAIYQAPLASSMVSWMPNRLLNTGSSVLRATGRRGANFLWRAAATVEDWYFTNANGIAFTEDERNRVLSPSMRTRLGIEGDAVSGRDRASRRRSKASPVARAVAGAQVRTGAASVGRKRVRDEEGRYRKAGLQVPPAAERGCVPAPQDIAAPIYDEAAPLDEVTRMQYVDMWFWLVGDVLLKTDKMAMAHSLESRVPFLDREVFRVASTVPTSQRVSGSQTKLALRQASESVIPQDWARKEKLGFPVPLASWLREERYYELVKREFTSVDAMHFFDVAELLRILDAHRAGEGDYSRRIWIVYMFLVWYRVYFVDCEKPERALAADSEALDA